MARAGIVVRIRRATSVGVVPSTQYGTRRPTGSEKQAPSEHTDTDPRRAPTTFVHTLFTPRPRA
ncbi:hypothetical protein [Streptomyces sp. SID8499]|uniref:hypothetical protein n=1 Tax=Streptomyces sp. SID8499 TaxID=2706106 RepID=UPI0013C58C98|nr:hypothetical protein [Streptomyces sp. SID8499]NED36745.1 hypothetical protein [Streptomyces sp. SID8499]